MAEVSQGGAEQLKAPLHPKHWPIWLGVGLLALLTRLPFSWQLGIGKGIGLLLHKVAGSRRRIAEVNMEICFPEKSPAERDALVRQIFIDNGIGLMETFMAGSVIRNGCARRLNLLVSTKCARLRPMARA